MSHYAAIVKEVLQSTSGLPDLEIQQVLIAAAPFHPASIDKWHEYGKEIFKQSGRKMFGFNYEKKVKDTV